MKTALLAACAAMSLGACATVTRGTTTAFVVQTAPSGAKVQTSLGTGCDSTPCAIPKVARNSQFDVTITKPGYKTVTANITHATNASGGVAMAGNILIGGLIGAVIDGTNGATQDLTPNPLVVTLEADGSAAVAETSTSSSSPASTVAAAGQAGS